MFQGFRSHEPAGTPEPLPIPPIDLQIPTALATATFGVG
jgi:hypothetical protein